MSLREIELFRSIATDLKDLVLAGGLSKDEAISVAGIMDDLYKVNDAYVERQLSLIKEEWAGE